VRTYPAIDILWPAPPSDDDVEQLLAALDDHEPTAVEEQAGGVRVFFGSLANRDAAAATTRDHLPGVTITPLLVPDEDWAERSQAALGPVRVGRIIVAPPWTLDDVRRDASTALDAPIVVAIQPSMGFGTGHHQSTRLCLQLLQRHLPSGACVLDIGTGSGVLAIAARALGATSALGIDVDRDALTSAAENVELNHAGQGVALQVVDITQGALDTLAGRFNLVFANITGAMLQRHAAAVVSPLAPGGVLITSGFQTHELADVTAAFAATGLERIDEVEEDTWMAAAFR
jgi:ribosomal protein L11 methyltransferase